MARREILKAVNETFPTFYKKVLSEPIRPELPNLVEFPQLKTISAIERIVHHPYNAYSVRLKMYIFWGDKFHRIEGEYFYSNDRHFGDYMG
jgi:hypothetical protein